MTVGELIEELKQHKVEDPVFVDVGICYEDDIQVEDVPEIGVVIGAR